MRVAILHNPRPAIVPEGAPDDVFEEYDGPETIEAIGAAIRGLGFDAVPVEAGPVMVDDLRSAAVDFVFNIAEGSGRRCREAIPAAICEYLGLPYSGSDPLTLGVTLDKWMARRVVTPDIPVAPGILVDGESPRFNGLRFPIVVKPNDEGSSKGIRAASVCRDASGAAAQCERLRAVYGCPVLVEEYLPGMEITAGVVGNGCVAEVIGLMEIAPVDDDEPFLYSVEVKRDYLRRVTYHVPPRMPQAKVDEVRAYALTAYRQLGCRDFARIDFRLDAAGVPHFLECNPLPGLNPISSDLVIMCRSTLSYEALVQRILLEASTRTGAGAGK